MTLHPCTESSDFGQRSDHSKIKGGNHPKGAEREGGAFPAGRFADLERQRWVSKGNCHSGFYERACPIVGSFLAVSESIGRAPDRRELLYPPLARYPVLSGNADGRSERIRANAHRRSDQR
jgi:hypothetical protein